MVIVMSQRLFIISKLSIIQVNQINNSVIIKIIILKVMNLKERGLTVGDLMIILIFVISTVFIINKVKDSDKQSYFQIAPNEILTTNKS